MRAALARCFASADVRAIAGITAVILVFFSPAWAQGRLLISDGQYNAFFAPLENWSDAWIGGWPAGADTAAFVWYPIRIVMMWAHLGFNAFVIAAYFLAAIGTYAYLRILAISPLPSAVGGLGFAFCGFMIAHLGHTSMIHASAWVPWMFAGVEGAITRTQRRWTFVTAVAVAMSLLAGHMQVTFYGIAALSAYLVWRAWACWNERRLRPWVLACLGVAGGVLVAAPQLLMTASYIDATPRAALDYKAFIVYSLPLQQLPTILFPYLFGQGTAVAQRYFGAGNFAETCCYVPFLSMALAIPGLRIRRDVSSFWLVLAVASLALALGGSLPPLAQLAFRVPGLNLFRVPARHVFEFGLAMSVLAAFGVQALGQTQSKRTLLAYMAAAAVLALVFIVISIPSLAFVAVFAKRVNVQLAPWPQNPAVGLGLVGIVAGLFAFMALVYRARYSQPVFIVAMLAGFASFTLSAAWRFVGHPIRDEGSIERTIVEKLRSQGGRMLYTDWASSSGLSADRARLLGISSVNWYGPLIPDRAKQLLRMTEYGAIAVPTLFDGNAALDLYGVRYVAVRDGAVATEIAAHAPLNPPRWEFLGKENNVAFYRNTRALPLGWLSPAWREASAPEALNTVQKSDSNSFDPRREALVTGIASGGDDSGSVGSVEIRWDGPGTIRADVDAPAGGFFVVSVNGVEGWTATVDGSPRPIYETDYALTGLPLEAGRHDVVFRYRVPKWKWAVPWTAAFAALICLMRITRRRRSEEEQRAA